MGFASQTTRAAAVVDDACKVLESSIPDVRAGDTLTASSWLGEGFLDALHAAEAHDTGVGGPRVARDFVRGTHWLVEARVLARSPWRAEIVAVDATAAVHADRVALWPKLVHSMQNASFGLRSVLDALERDRPAAAELDEYLAHLFDPCDRISTTMARLAACLVPPKAVCAPVRVDSLVEIAVARVAPARRPAQLQVCDGTMEMVADVDLLADTLVAMIESGEKTAPALLEIGACIVDGRPHARIALERRANGGEARVAVGMWDLGGSHHDLPLRLTLARAVIFAHGGDVHAEIAGPGHVRLIARIPLRALSPPV